MQQDIDSCQSAAVLHDYFVSFVREDGEMGEYIWTGSFLSLSADLADFNPFAKFSHISVVEL